MATTTTSSSLLALPSFRSNCNQRPSFKVRAQISGDKATSVEPVNGSVSVSNLPNPKGSEVNGKVKFQREAEIELLWDDGYGSKSVKDYFAAAREILKKPDGGPPRWFSPVDCGQPIKDAPTLFFLPGKNNIFIKKFGFLTLIAETALLLSPHKQLGFYFLLFLLSLKLCFHLHFFVFSWSKSFILFAP